jgi:hypothetical protein
MRNVQRTWMSIFSEIVGIFGLSGLAWRDDQHGMPWCCTEGVTSQLPPPIQMYSKVSLSTSAKCSFDPH